MNEIKHTFRSVKTLKKDIIELFKNHIGKENAIIKEDLYKELYGEEIEDTPTAWLRWMKIAQRISSLRARSYIFIIVENFENNTLFYVLKTMEEYKLFEHRQNKAILAKINMRDRARLAVQEEWYKKLSQKEELKRIA